MAIDGYATIDDLTPPRPCDRCRSVPRIGENGEWDESLFRGAAASFHWIDRPVMAAAVRVTPDPDGVVVHVDNRHQDSLRPSALVVPDGRELRRTIDDIVAEVFSMSSTAPHLFGDRQDDVEAELREILERAAGARGHIGVRLPDNGLKIRRQRGAETIR